MEKLKKKEKARLIKLAEEYYQKICENRHKVHNALDEEQLRFLRGTGVPIQAELGEHLKSGKKPSDYFKTKGSWIFEGCILESHKEALFSLIDGVREFIIQDAHTQTSYRPISCRSSDYFFYIRTIQYIIMDFEDINWIDVDYADFLENHLSEEQAAYKKSRVPFHSDGSYLLTYEIDAGNERVINATKNTLESGNDAAINRSMLSAIFRCKNTELHELVCKLLSTAKPEDRLVREICKSCYYGRKEPFLMVLKIIRDNELLRSSSVRKIIGVFTTLLSKESHPSDAKRNDAKRIDAKILDIIINCLEDENYIEECLQGEDSMEIYIALWAIGRLEINTCIERLFQIIDHGSSLQAMTAGIFIKNNCYLLEIYFPPEDVLRPHHFAVQAVLKRHEELDIMTIYLLLMMQSQFCWSHVKGKYVTDMAERYSREDAERLYVILHETLAKLPEKNLEFDLPYVFFQEKAALTKADVLKPLFVVTADLGDDAKIDETCVNIPLIRKEGWWYDRSVPIRMLLSEPKTEIQLDTLVSLTRDRQKKAKEEAFTILKKCQLDEKHFRMLEDMLKYKTNNMHQDLIDVLLRQPEEQLFSCVKRLCMDKKEEKRTAGLEMLIRICRTDRDDTVKSDYRALINLIEHPSYKEKFLIEKICGEAKREQEEGYGLYRESDDFIPNVDEEFIANCKADFVKLFPETKLFGNKPKRKKIGMHDIISALDELIEEHKNDKYVDSYAGECLLGNDSIDRTFQIKDNKGNRYIAFRELWDSFYKQYIDDENLLLKLRIYSMSGAKNIYKQSGSDKFAKKIYGNEFISQHTYRHCNTILMVLHYYYDNYLNAANYDTIACALGYYIAYEATTKSLYDIVNSNSKYDNASVKFIYVNGKKIKVKNMKGREVATIISNTEIGIFLSILSFPRRKNKEYFRNVFSIQFMLGKRFRFEDKRDYPIRHDYWTTRYTPLTVSDLILAAYQKIISQGFLYKMLMTNFLSPALTNLSLLLSYKKSGDTTNESSRFCSYRNGETFIKTFLEMQNPDKLSEYKPTAADHKRLDFAAKIGENLLEVVLNVELAREDAETEFSKELGSIEKICGQKKFIKILTAMGKDPFDCSTYFSTYGGVSKQQALSYLLGICVPDPEDDAAQLKELLSTTDITEDRLVEAALFSTAWLDIIEEYLGWKGFKSACYYFIAHIGEAIDRKTEEVIAKYTPISIKDLQAGTCDAEWLKEAFRTVGEERFNRIYKAAKCISTRARHTRAKKYINAMKEKI